MDMIVGDRLAALLEGGHRHHDTRRAEAALSAVVFQERLLHWMQFAVLIGQSLDREYSSAIKLRKQQQAGIDRMIHGPSVFHAGNNDRASAAVACTPFLGAN